jgi:2-dehydro-3-deoxygluconokinase
MYEVVTLGETMLRLTPPDKLRLEQAEQFQVHIGGSESNTAVGLARLGHSTAWISRLTDNALGRKIVNAITAHGVDTSHVVWTDEDRIGIYYFEQAHPPRGNLVLYDRQGSSFSRFSPDMLPSTLFVPGGSCWLHLTGISLGLSETTSRLIHASADLAKRAGWKVSFDVNYRAKLWSADKAAEACRAIVPMCDLLITPMRDASILWGQPKSTTPAARSVSGETAGSPADWAREFIGYLRDKLSYKGKLVLTMGQQGAAGEDGGEFHFAATTAVEPIGRLGGGDAFAAGLISGLLDGSGLQAALYRGNAAAGLKYSIGGDLPLFTRDEVLKLAQGQTHLSAVESPFR